LRLQGGLDGLAGKFAGGRDGEGLDLGKDLTVGGLVGSLLQLPGEQERLLDDEGLEGALGPEGAWGHGGSSLRAREPPGYLRLPRTTRNHSRTPDRHG
jgi:hypothetical protein